MFNYVPDRGRFCLNTHVMSDARAHSYRREWILRYDGEVISVRKPGGANSEIITEIISEITSEIISEFISVVISEFAPPSFCFSAITLGEWVIQVTDLDNVPNITKIHLVRDITLGMNESW